MDRLEMVGREELGGAERVLEPTPGHLRDAVARSTVAESGARPRAAVSWSVHRLDSTRRRGRLSQSGACHASICAPTPSRCRPQACGPLRTEGSLSGILPVLWDTEHIPSGAELDLLNGFAEQTGLAFGQAQLRRARELAATDSLTGLANHRAFRDALTARMAEARRHEGRLAILFCDLDRFKAVNDRHGHGVGDLLLHRIAGAIRGIARTEDVVARYGGDEIALLLPGADREVALEVGQRLRERVRGVEGGMDVDLTVGVAVFPDDADEPEALIGRADSAMYAGKRLGGGRVVAADEMPAEA